MMFVTQNRRVPDFQYFMQAVETQNNIFDLFLNALLKGICIEEGCWEMSAMHLCTEFKLSNVIWEYV